MGTRHGKQHQFAPAFRDLLGAELRTPPDLDTDQFGTFTGEVTRAGPPVAAARAKARLAIEVTGLPYGLATEASYGFLAGGMYGHEEIALFCDDIRGIEVLEGHRSAVVPGLSHSVAAGESPPEALVAGLPGQALTVRPAGSGRYDRAAVKGITDVDALVAAIAAAAGRCPDGLALVEPDLRAHHNPSRRDVLARLARTLARRLASRCPACGTPGFGRVDAETGLPCLRCGTPTALVRNEIHGCAGCPHRVSRPAAGIPAAGADPAVCPACNP